MLAASLPRPILVAPPVAVSFARSVARAVAVGVPLPVSVLAACTLAAPLHEALHAVVSLVSPVAAFALFVLASLPRPAARRGGAARARAHTHTRTPNDQQHTLDYTSLRADARKCQTCMRSNANPAGSPPRASHSAACGRGSLDTNQTWDEGSTSAHPRATASSPHAHKRACSLLGPIQDGRGPSESITCAPSPPSASVRSLRASETQKKKREKQRSPRTTPAAAVPPR